MAIREVPQNEAHQIGGVLRDTREPMKIDEDVVGGSPLGQDASFEGAR